MTLARSLYRFLSITGDVRAASRGPAPLGRRIVRHHAHKWLARALRRAGL